MPTFLSEWAATTLGWHASTETVLPLRVWNSDTADLPNVDAKLPGGTLVWATRRSNGESHIHGSRVHQTVESALVNSDNPTADSKLDTYVPPRIMISSTGRFPFGRAAGVYQRNGNPLVVGLAAKPVMFAVDTFNIEQQSLSVEIADRPTLISVAGSPSQKKIRACLKMVNGNVVFVETNETADLSSSSSITE